MMPHLRTHSRWPRRLAMICTALSLASAGWSQNLTSVTLSRTPIIIGQPFTITITSTSESETALRFSIQGCPTCTVVPPSATYVANATIQTYTVTIFSPVAFQNARFTVTYENKSVSSALFNGVYATAEQLSLQVFPASASIGQLFDVGIRAQDNAGNLASA